MEHTPISVATSSTLILAATEKRDSLLLVNDSDTKVYIKFAEAAVVGEGIPLAANGGFISFSGGKVTPSAIYGIHGGTGTKKVLVSAVEYP